MKPLDDSNRDRAKGSKPLTVVLTVLLAFTGLTDMFFGGIAAQFQPESLADEYNADYVTELDGLISVFGVLVFVWGIATLLAAKWVWNRRREGAILGALAGVKLLVVSIVTYALNDRFSILIFDGLRGAIIATLAIVLLKNRDFIRTSEGFD